MNICFNGRILYINIVMKKSLVLKYKKILREIFNRKKETCFIRRLSTSRTFFAAALSFLDARNELHALIESFRMTYQKSEWSASLECFLPFHSQITMHRQI